MFFVQVPLRHLPGCSVFEIGLDFDEDMEFLAETMGEVLSERGEVDQAVFHGKRFMAVPHDGVGLIVVKEGLGFCSVLISGFPEKTTEFLEAVQQRLGDRQGKEEEEKLTEE